MVLGDGSISSPGVVMAEGELMPPRFRVALRARMPRPESSVSSCQDQKNEKANVKHACVRDRVDKIMLDMS